METSTDQRYCSHIDIDSVFQSCKTACDPSFPRSQSMHRTVAIQANYRRLFRLIHDHGYRSGIFQSDWVVQLVVFDLWIQPMLASLRIVRQFQRNGGKSLIEVEGLHARIAGHNVDQLVQIEIP